jgi:hypothetical protein
MAKSGSWDMRLTIDGPDGPILVFGGADNIVPKTAGEREIAFNILSRSLAMLAGIGDTVENDMQSLVECQSERGEETASSSVVLPFARR